MPEKVETEGERFDSMKVVEEQVKAANLKAAKGASLETIAGRAKRASRWALLVGTCGKRRCPC